MNSLGKIETEQKTGNEPFVYEGKKIGATILDFWKWSVSDIVNNTTRGHLAEFIVAKALKVDLSSVRQEWEPYDLTTPEGIRIEVKSAAYIQNWAQKDFSAINFSIRPTRSWDNLTGRETKSPSRDSDIYVFCSLYHKNQGTLNPLNLEQWKFFVLSTEAINRYERSRQSITLKYLEKLTEPIGYSSLKEKTIQEYKTNYKTLSNMDTTVKLHRLSLADARTYAFAAIFVAGNIALPQLAHLLPKGGLVFLPIYFFTLIAAYKYGLSVGLLTAAASPLVNHWLFGMPGAEMLAVILIKSTLLATAAAYAAKKAGNVSLLAIAGAVGVYQLIGSLAEWGITSSWAAALQDMRLGLPGIALQIFGGYAVLRLLRNV